VKTHQGVANLEEFVMQLLPCNNYCKDL
jgi:hypothetical protein